MIKYLKYSYIAIIIPCFLLISFFLNSISLITVSLYLLLIALISTSIFIEKRKNFMKFYILIILIYLSILLSQSFIKNFSLTIQSIFPFVTSISIPLICFLYLKKDVYEGFRGSLRIRAKYKINDDLIIKEKYEIIIPYSSISYSFLSFPLVFILNSELKILINIVLILLLIVEVELITITKTKIKKKEEKKSLKRFTESLNNKNNK